MADMIVSPFSSGCGVFFQVVDVAVLVRCPCGRGATSPASQLLGKSEKCDVASCGDAECGWGCFQVSETRIQMHLGGTMLRARRVDIRERRVLEELETQMEALRLRFVRLHGEGDSVVSSAGKSYGWLGRWRCCRTCLGGAVDRSAAGGV